MSALESTWIYVAVPAATITILVLLKLKMQKTRKPPEDSENTLTDSEQEPAPQEPTVEPSQHATETPEQTDNVEAPHAEMETPQVAVDQEKPEECRHYMGFLYMRKGSENANIPSECYGCRRLLRCLYSPQIIEKVYGE